MSTDELFPLPEPAGVPNIAQLRFAVGFHQGAAVAALRKAEREGGESLGSDRLDVAFLAADDVQAEVLVWLREWRERDETCNSDDPDEWGHPEGPLTVDERKMMEIFQAANDRLNDLRMAIYALRARELAELQEAGAVVTLARGGVK